MRITSGIKRVVPVAALWASTLLVACATPYRNTITATAAGVAIGGIYGMSRPEYQNQNATMYASLGGLVAGTTALLLDVDKTNQNEIKLENEKLKIKLNEFQARLEPKLISQGSSLFESPLPKEVSALIEPGSWKRYQMNEWVQDPNQSNIWYRQVEMFEITPPVAR